MEPLALGLPLGQSGIFSFCSLAVRQEVSLVQPCLGSSPVSVQRKTCIASGFGDSGREGWVTGILRSFTHPASLGLPYHLHYLYSLPSLST